MEVCDAGQFTEWAQPAAGASTCKDWDSEQYHVDEKNLHAAVGLSFGAISGGEIGADLLCVYADVEVRRWVMTKGGSKGRLEPYFKLMRQATGIVVEGIDAEAGTEGGWKLKVRNFKTKFI